MTKRIYSEDPVRVLNASVRDVRDLNLILAATVNQCNEIKNSDVFFLIGQSPNVLLDHLQRFVSTCKESIKHKSALQRTTSCTRSCVALCEIRSDLLDVVQCVSPSPGD